MKKSLTLLIMLFVGLCVWATDITFTAADFTPVTEADYSTTKEGVTVAVVGSTVTSDQLRIFKGKTITISCSTGSISKIEFTCTANGAAKYGPGSFTAPDGYTFEDDGPIGTWTGSASEVTFTAEKNQVRTTQIVVTVSEGGGETKTATAIEFGEYLTRFTPGKDGDETNLPNVIVTAGDAIVEGAEVKWSLKMGNNWIMGEEEPSTGDGKVYIPNHSCGDLTLTAKYEGNDQYEGSSKSYTMKVYKGFLNIQSILEEFPVVGSDTWAAKEVEWNKGYQASYWQVDEQFSPKTAIVTYANGSYTYIKDEYGSLLLYGSGLGFKKGDEVALDMAPSIPPHYSGVYGTLKTYNGLLELAVNKDDVELYVKSSDNPVEPKTITLAELNQTNMNEFVRIENAEFVEVNGKNLTFKVGDETLAVYNQFGIKVADDEGKSLLEPGTKYNLEGMGDVYWKNSTLTNQLYLTNFEEAVDEVAIKSFKMTINCDGEEFTEEFPASDWQNKVIEGKTSSIKIKQIVVETGKPMKYVGFIATMYKTEDGWQHDEEAWQTTNLEKRDDGTWAVDLGDDYELIPDIDGGDGSSYQETFEFFIYAEDEAGTPIHYNNGGQDKNYKVTFTPREDPTAIGNVNVNDNVNTKLYNMSGQPVTRTYRGVVIQNARKVLR